MRHDDHVHRGAAATDERAVGRCEALTVERSSIVESCIGAGARARLLMFQRRVPRLPFEEIDLQTSNYLDNRG
jgi:hypothetical protein